MQDNDNNKLHTSPGYHGPNRRGGGERRVAHDRREMIRFEMKDDRRSGKDRRQQDGWGKALSRY